jgi:tight adherence protein B
MQIALIAILVVVLVYGTITLMLDSRQRRIDHHVERTVQQSRSTGLLSIRRQQVEPRWRFLHRIANYRPGITYHIRPEFVIVGGIMTAVAIFYANSFVNLSFDKVGLAASLVGLATVRGLFGWQQRRMANLLFRQLPDAIELVRSTVQSGLPVNDAFKTIAESMPEPTAGQFAIVCDEMRLGKSPDEALDGVHQRVGVTEYAIFAVALAVQARSGGRLTETIQTLGDQVRQRVTLAARAKAMAGEVIFSARALSVSPVLIGGFLYWINPRIVDLLFTDPTGRMLLAYAIASVIAGTLVIRWMVRRETAV